MNLYHISYISSPIDPTNGAIRKKASDGGVFPQFNRMTKKIVATDAEHAIQKLRSYHVDNPHKSGENKDELTIQRVDTVVSVENLGFIDVL